MRFSEALEQIAEIHERLSCVDVYRGFRSVPVAVSGLCGLLAALFQSMAAPMEPIQTLRFWIAVGLVSGAIGLSDAVTRFLFVDGAHGRRQTRRVLGQFAPCMVAGVAVTLGFHRLGPSYWGLLPGLWALLFGLGVFAARPSLPRAAGWVGLYYLTVGGALLAFADPAEIGLAFGWSIGATFVIGQFAAAWVLYWNLERTDHGG